MLDESLFLDLDSFGLDSNRLLKGLLVRAARNGTRAVGSTGGVEGVLHVSPTGFHVVAERKGLRPALTAPVLGEEAAIVALVHVNLRS